MPRTVLVAIGGKSLVTPGEPLTVATQRRRVADTARALADIIAGGWRVVVTHGNGPQVGAALRRSELGAAEAYPLPLDLCVASTQGELGSLLHGAISEALAARALERPVAAIVTHTVVSLSDPAFAEPTKPIGSFYSSDEAARRRRAGWTLGEEPPHGYRRVVASPEPLEIVEEGAIQALLDVGTVVIALGGGGIPVVRAAGRLDGVDAVIDKDLASALLAAHVGADVLVISTDVEYVFANFASPRSRALHRVTASELRALAAEGHFPAGTMGPKVEAALRFIGAGGREAIITAPERLADALGQPDTGTHVVHDAGRDSQHRAGALASTVFG
jgi:carbamate kinase